MHAVFVGGYLIALASLISWQSPLQHRLHFHSFRQRPLGTSLNLHEGTSLLEDTWPQLCSEESSHGRDPITPPNLAFFMPLKQHCLNDTIKFSFQLEMHPGSTDYISINALFSFSLGTQNPLVFFHKLGGYLCGVLLQEHSSFYCNAEKASL